jgi:hypothetical protein
MGVSKVDACKSRLESAEFRLKAAKANMATAKANGNYKNAIKNNRFGGKLGNHYDYNVWCCQEEVKKAKADLAEAKRAK